ncbi:MAG: hypothetical protein E7378_00830 [Clostridiales bacterium]|nr:hypothetical protein [Clostridiales bacterium]
MKNLVEYKIKNLNREKLFAQILEISIIKNINTTDTELSFCVEAKKAKKVENLLNKKQISIISKRQKGVFRFLKSGILRLGVILPIFIFFALALVCNFFVFQFDIVGNSLVQDDEIVQVLKQNNYLGITPKSKIKVFELETELQKIDKVSFASVILRGNTIVINIKEKVYNSEYEDKDGFKPLLSEFNGVITDMAIIQGTPLVKAGQTVKVGQALVAPYVIDTNGQKLNIKPMADIKADVFFTCSKTFSDTKIDYVDTGNIQKFKTISLFNMNIFSNEQQSSFETYRTETKKEFLVNNSLLPIVITYTTHYQQEQVITKNYFEANKQSLIDECGKIARQNIKDYEIIKEEYYNVESNVGLNIVTYTVVVNKSIC